ncbi:MAG: hypothetical protein AUJ07_03985 [Crenarchaeota archaeon 13_1_40CM_3_53_5]|nr:MAG: hypothetical protein AUJ07_03985 [Crenarchaeota archaeon 13_1_40CM_3_53_5]
MRGARHVFVPERDYRQSGDMLEWVLTGERPDGSTSFLVNYTFDEPSGITDVNPGSVVRTIVEAVAREINFLYEELDQVYNAGFVDTANGKSLEMVVSLLGIERTPPQNATGNVFFGRASQPEEINVDNEVHLFDGNLSYELKTQPVSRLLAVKGTVSAEPNEFKEGSDFSLEENSIRWLPTGKLPDKNSSFTVSYIAHQRILVPSGVTITTSSRDPKRVRGFMTTEDRVLRKQRDGRWEVEVPIRAVHPGRQGNVPAGAIQVMPKPPLGLEYVINNQDISTGTDAETDEQLRARAKKALEAAGKATLVSIESAIRRIEGVKSILIQDRPDNVAGVIRVVVDGGEDKEVQRAIDDTRSAGIFVEFARPKKASIDIKVTGIVPPGTNRASAQAGVEDRIRSYLSKQEIGEDIVYRRLMAKVLEGNEIYDVEELSIIVSREGEPAATVVGENVLMSRDERSQVRNVNVSVKERE